MKRTIAVGILGFALLANGAAAQTAVEQAQILRDFEVSVVEYAQRHQCFNLFPAAINAETPAQNIFTLPVAIVFRQLIARAIAAPQGGEAIGAAGARGVSHPMVLRPFPGDELYDFPKVLSDALPAVPAPLEYRLIGDDLVIRDGEADVIVAVLRNALGSFTTR
jgi:hypothetical protein